MRLLSKISIENGKKSNIIKPCFTDTTSLLLRRFVFRKVEASDWWWAARDHGKGTDGRRSKAKPDASFPPSFACERETSGWQPVWVRGRDTTITDNLPCPWAKKVVLTFSPDSARLIQALSVAPRCPYQRSLTVKVMSHGTIRNDDF